MILQASNKAGNSQKTGQKGAPWLSCYHKAVLHNILAVLKHPDPMVAHLFFFLVPSCMLCFKNHHDSVLLPVQIPEHWFWHKSYSWPHLFIKTFSDRDSKCSKWRQLFFFLFLCKSVLSNLFLLYFWNSRAFPVRSWSVLLSAVEHGWALWRISKSTLRYTDGNSAWEHHSHGADFTTTELNHYYIFVVSLKPAD